MTATRTKRFLLMAGALLLIGLFVFTFMNQTVDSFVIDINPSFRVDTNRMNRINALTPLDDDAKELLKGYNADGKTVDEMVEELVDRLVLRGYLQNGRSNEILVSGQTGALSEQTLQNIRTILNKNVSDRNLKSEVTGILADDDALSKEARELGVSAGKMTLIRRIIAKDPAQKAETLKDRSIQELTLLIDDLDRPETEKPRTEAPKTEAPKATEPTRTEAPRTERPAPVRRDDDDDDDWDDDDDDDWDDDDDDWDDDDRDDDDWDDDDDDDWDDDDRDDDDDDDDDWDDDDWDD